LLAFHLPPIQPVVCRRSYPVLSGEGAHLGVGFLLRCFQQLSPPEVATEQCRWHDNSHTSAPSSPVLSY